MDVGFFSASQNVVTNALKMEESCNSGVLLLFGVVERRRYQ